MSAYRFKSVPFENIDAENGVYYVADLMAGKVTKYVGVEAHNLNKVFLVSWSHRKCVFESEEAAQHLLDMVNSTIEGEVV